MSKDQKYNKFLPTSKKEIDLLGWDHIDVILFTGDAYIDHPSFGAAVIARVLQKAGYNVAIIPQPNWRDDLRDFKKLGKPKLFFAVTSGNMDSMVNHYTANKRLRSDDAYTAGGKSGNRPDYAVKVYSQILKKLYPEVPLVIGGVEASLRRFTHYDYWSNNLLPSILVDSQADMLIYGMGEKSIVELADRMSYEKDIQKIQDISQTAFLCDKRSIDNADNNSIWLNSYEQCINNPQKFGENFKLIEIESNKMVSNRIIEPIDNKIVVVNPPFPATTTKELDSWYDLPYARQPHPRYLGKRIPAWEMIKYSVNLHRGCFGGCSFCTISAHQGKFVSSRSEISIIKEIKKIVEEIDFKGYLSDLGGPSANMYRMQGKNLKICEKCTKPSCIYPNVCNNLDINHSHLLNLYRKVRSLNGIKKAFIGSGVRYDLFSDWSNPINREYFEELVRYHVSGRLKVAPEHTEEEVLKQMRKPPFKLFDEMKKKFDTLNRKYSLNQQIVPYFISSHPGCNIEHMNSLSKVMERVNIQPEQIQDFTPTPLTLASTIFYTGTDPYTGKKVYVAREKEEKLKQKDLFFWKKKPKSLSKTISKGLNVKKRNQI